MICCKMILLNLLCAFSALLCAQQGDKFDTAKAFEFAKRYENKAVDAVPQWARRDDAPLFRIAWLSDMHILDEASADLNRQACRAIRETIRPDAVFITGDNSWITSGPIWRRYCSAPALDGQPPAIRNQRFFQEFLRLELPGIKCHVIPGDNWHQGFATVFGSDKFAFSWSGFRFVFAAPDSSGNENGCALMNDATFKWLEQELRQHANEPVVYIQHEPLVPPTILENDRILAMLEASHNVVGILSGHLHLDLDFPVAGGGRQWCAPAIGRSHRPGFKVLSFYPDMILAESHEWQPQEKSFAKVMKFQHIDIPGHLRNATAAGKRRDAPGDFQSLPPAERQDDPALDARQGEIFAQLRLFAPKLLIMRGF